jgi:dihydroxyacetone kinase phosphotransfer subunit
VLALLILSHSPDVAKGVRDICLQMTSGEVVIEAIGGTADGQLGIDAEKVFNSLQELTKKYEGVVIIGDIGSTILAAKNAINLLGVPKNVKIADAPLVEGAIVASVEASLGSSLDEVIKKAEEVKFLSKL